MKHLIRMTRRHDLTKKRQWQRQIRGKKQRVLHIQRQWQKKNTFREHRQRAILKTCDLCDIWSEWWGDMTWPKTKDKAKDQDKRMTWLVNLCEINVISDSWEPEFMTIIVTWQLRVTLHSIRNSPDVFLNKVCKGHSECSKWKTFKHYTVLPLFEEWLLIWHCYIPYLVRPQRLAFTKCIHTGCH